MPCTLFPYDLLHGRQRSARKGPQRYSTSAEQHALRTGASMSSHFLSCARASLSARRSTLLGIGSMQFRFHFHRGYIHSYRLTFKDIFNFPPVSRTTRGYSSHIDVSRRLKFASLANVTGRPQCARTYVNHAELWHLLSYFAWPAHR